MLNFASSELGEWREPDSDFGFANVAPASARASRSSRVKIIAGKIRVPQIDEEEAAHAVRRPRLFAHLEKSLAHFSATLVTGRTGTGKTALAADFARSRSENEDLAVRGVAWYKIETTDFDWNVFSSYFAESLAASRVDAAQTAANKNSLPIVDDDQSVTDRLAAEFAALDAEKPLLIVLDDLHSVFDADWFAEFFNALLGLPAANVRLLLLARSQPPVPLWRLRSKHALDVLDENLLAFTAEEAVEFFRHYELPQTTARNAHKIAYGKIAKLKEIAEKKK